MNKLKLIGSLAQIKHKVGNQSVFILGHKVIDVDSYVSMALVQKLLLSYGINAKASLLIDESEIDPSTLKVIGDLECIFINKENINASDFFFLVDHNNPEESFKEMKRENIVGIIDHHEDENINSDLKIIKALGSTSRIVFKLFEELDFEISRQYKLQVLISLLIDTTFLMNTKTNESDIVFANQLLLELEIDIQDLKEKYLTPTNLEIPIDKLAKNGFKEYDIEGNIVKSSYIEFLDKDKDIVKSKTKEIVGEIKKIEHDLFILILINLTLGKTETISFNRPKEKVLTIRFDNITSRAKTIMPMIRKQIKDRSIDLSWSFHFKRN